MTVKFQDVQPKFFKAGPMPYAFRTNVEKELETDGFIQPVQFSCQATPIVPVVKQDASTYQDLRQLQNNNNIRM